MRAIRYIAAAAALALSAMPAPVAFAGQPALLPSLSGTSGPINRRRRFKANRRADLKRSRKGCR